MNVTQERMKLIEQRLTEALQPIKLEIVDDSGDHIGHAGNDGGGHFSIEIIAEAFIGKSAVERHQMIYQALGSAIGNEIHALSINATEPAAAT